MDKRRTESEADGDGRVGDVASPGGVTAGNGEGGVGCNGLVAGVGTVGCEVGAAGIEDCGLTHAAGNTEVGKRERAAIGAVKSDVAVIDRETSGGETGGWG